MSDVSDPWRLSEAIDPALPYQSAPQDEQLAFIEVARRRHFLVMVQTLAQSAREHGFAECSALLSETHERLIPILYRRTLPVLALVSSWFSVLQSA